MVEDDDDEEAQHRAFRYYMLHGRSPSTPVRMMKTACADPDASAGSSSKNRNSNNNNNNKALFVQQQQRRKKFYSLLQSFQRCVQEWLHIDDQLGQVTYSIANLRQRCWVTSRALALLLEEEKQQQQRQQQQLKNQTVSSSSKNESSGLCWWKSHGYRSKEQLLLPSLEPVLQLTLDDELIQHEKMMVLLRRWLSLLAQEQETLGRRLEDLLLLFCHHDHDYDHQTRNHYNHDEEKEDVLIFFMSEKVEECQQLFAALARELYRKQILSQDVFDSTNDALLYCDDATTTNYGDVDVETGSSSSSTIPLPRRTAEKCANQWPHTCPSSELREFSALLDDWSSPSS